VTANSHKLGVFIAVLWLVASAVFLRSLPVDPDATWVDLLIFVGLAAVSERWYVATSKESGMSLSFTVHFAAAVLFGPAFAMVVAVCGLLVADGLIRRAPHVRTAFNVAQMAISVGLCGLLYQALAADGPLDFVADAGALALAALVYLVVNDSLVAAVLSVRGRSFFQEWRLSFKDILLPYVSMAPLGALVAYTYQATPWSLLLFPPLILVIYNGFKLFVSLQRETDNALVALADSIDRRDTYTYRHSIRVAEFVELMARKMKLPPREIDLVVAAARVHDLGKISTDNRVLLKPSSLTPEERELIRRHAVDGADLAGKFSMFHQGRLYIRHHHERWDGTGYPDGLAGAVIPLGARLIAVADAFEAMTSDRPYRKALPTETAIQELRHCAGTQFDPDVVQALAEAIGEALPSIAGAPAVEQLQPWSPGDLAAELASSKDSSQLWAAAGFTLARLLDVPLCDLHRRREDGDFDCVASIRGDSWYPLQLGRSTHLTASGLVAAALETRTPTPAVSQDDPRLTDRERAEMRRWAARARALVPLVIKDEVLGLAEIGETRENLAITSRQLETAASTCTLIALAVRDAKIIDDQRVESRRLASLLESSRAVASAKSSDDALAVVTRKACELFDVSGCVAYEFERDHSTLVARAIWQASPGGHVRVGDTHILSDCPAEQCLLDSGGARLERQSDPELDPTRRATLALSDARSLLTVPMQSVDGVMGLLTLWDSARERTYSDEELALASSLAELAGETVRGAKLLRRLQGLSETDSLTGLANHRKVHEHLALTHARAERYQTQFSVAMLDIDNFKPLNDTYGHQAGDAALRQVAGLLKDQTRASDIPSRCGGDEFLLILPETTAAEAIVLADKLRDELARRPFVTPSGERVHLSASIGIAAYPQDGRTTQDLIAVADANLYAAKRRGGDAVGRGAPVPSDGGPAVPQLAGPHTASAR
jgi:diguanylate cyclase (GGDEF)-like protein/putative nucleotidyltransferase with HDIG domain